MRVVPGSHKAKTFPFLANLLNKMERNKCLWRFLLCSKRSWSPREPHAPYMLLCTPVRSDSLLHPPQLFCEWCLFG